MDFCERLQRGDILSQFGLLLDWHDRSFVHSLSVGKIHDFNRCQPASASKSMWLQSEERGRIQQ